MNFLFKGEQMRKLKHNQIVIKNDIYDTWGRIYISKGRVITLNSININKFKKIGIWEQIITNADAMCDQEKKTLFEDEVKEMRKIYVGIKACNFTNAIDFVQNIIFEEKVFNRYPYLLTLLEHSKLCYTHSINVVILSVILANAVNYDVQTIKEIAIGALLHDIGFIFIPKDIIEKDESELNEEEMSIRQNHCNLGIMTMKSANIPFRSQKIIEQHHEKLDGTGYPNGLNVRDILEEAHIVSIAEELDMRTSYFQGGATEIGEVIQDMVNLPEKFSRKYTELLKSIFEV